MPTITEINNPDVKYCQQYELHCPCYNCGNPECFGDRAKICDNCAGPFSIEEAKKIFKRDNVSNNMCFLLRLSHSRVNGDDPAEL